MRPLYRGADAPETNLSIKSESGDITCFRSAPHMLGDGAAASCLFLESEWTALYIGQRQDLERFFETLRTVK
jgi:hypothetical protein